MEIEHRLSLNWDKNKKWELATHGIEVNEGFDAFKISESSPNWPEIQRLIAAWEPVDIVTTRFSRRELRCACELKIGSDWHYGYPQPEGAFGYLTTTFDLTNHCAACGIGKKQSSPFRMKGEPKWGKRQMMQLNWVFDVFFTQPQTWESVFAPFGIAATQVLNHRTDKPLDTVVQLSIDSDVTIPNLDQPSEACPACGRVKFIPISRGMFPALNGMRGLHLAKTQEYFGSGASAWNAVIVSAELYQALDKANVRGVYFSPVAQN